MCFGDWFPRHSKAGDGSYMTNPRGVVLLAKFGQLGLTVGTAACGY